MRPSIMSEGADDVDAGLGLREGLTDQHVERDVVQDIAGLVDHAVLAVRRVRIERHVGHDAELRETLLERADRPRHQPFPD